MYAVIKTGGKQYRVQPGDLLVVEKLEGEPGAKVAFGEVLMLGDGEAVTIGAPIVEGATVSATLIETRKGEKVKIFKKKRRQGYRRTLGHRQFESVLRVTAIAGAGADAKWDGEVSLVTKAELNARSRGLVYVSPEAAAEAKAAKTVKAAPVAKPAAKTKKVVEAADEVVASKAVTEAADTYAEANTPAEAEGKKAAAPKKAAAKAEAEAPAAEAKKAAPKKAAAPKAEAAAETKKPAAKKAAPKKDKGAE